MFPNPLFKEVWLARCRMSHVVGDEAKHEWEVEVDLES